MAATFQVTCDSGEYSFDLVDDTGTKLLIGGKYANQEEAESVIKDVRVGTLMSTQIAASKVPSGEMFFVIKNSAGQIIAKSLLFDNQMTFDAVLHTVKDNACVAEISTVA